MRQQSTSGQGAPSAATRARITAVIIIEAGVPPIKDLKSSISEIANDTFKMGQNHFTACSPQSRKNMASCIQQSGADDGYLVTETIRTGKEQKIDPPPPVDKMTLDAADQKIIQEELGCFLF